MADFEGRSRRTGASAGDAGRAPATPGKRSLIEATFPVQLHRADGQAATTEDVHAAAAAGIADGGGPLPFLDRIQASFGEHDVSGVRAHVGGAAAGAAAAMGAEAYATGDHVAFGGAPDLHTAAHEAAHVVQQRGGVSLKGGVGESGDAYERHADRVADQVVAGASAAALLDEMAPPGARRGGAAVQGKNLAQHGLAGGLTDSGTGVLVNRDQKGKVYAQTVSGRVAGRTAALTTAAAHNAVVGNRTVDKTWTRDEQKFNDNAAASLDPFLYEVTVPFKQGDDEHTLTLRYQHADRWTGYVTQIEDSSNAETDGGATMFNKFEGKKRDSDKFGNVHDTANTGSTKVAEDTEGDEEHNLDAYTKIAGEGARWQCVRAHAANLRNDSLFFTAATDTTKVMAITFQQLWLNWVGAFGPRYDIPDGDVVKAMKGEIKGKGTRLKPAGSPLVGLRTLVAKTSLAAKDYNLDAHASHVVPVEPPKKDTK
jgi:hypothetical protein